MTKKKIVFGKREELDYRTNEAYKSLRTNIQFCGNDIKVICLTSCTPSEGKSSITFNLAVSLAQNGKKVVLIDADLRKSILAGRYKVGEIESGLTHYLSGQKELQDVLLCTDVENMDIIFSGPYAPNPAELLGHNRFVSLVQELREQYDYVLIDTPPLGSVIDAAIISKLTDGAILIIESGAISYKFAQNVKKQLEKSDCKILGTILNKVELEKKSYYGKYYGSYGAYGSGKIEENK